MQTYNYLQPKIILILTVNLHVYLNPSIIRLLPIEQYSGDQHQLCFENDN